MSISPRRNAVTAAERSRLWPISVLSSGMAATTCPPVRIGSYRCPHTSIRSGRPGSRAASTARSAAARVCRAGTSNRCPASVSRTVRACRVNKTTPSSRSSRAIRLDNACWVRKSRPAARPKCSSSAAVTNARTGARSRSTSPAFVDNRWLSTKPERCWTAGLSAGLLADMRALVPAGRPGALVSLAETGLPEPRPGEALVKVEAFSVNRGEIFQLEQPRPGTRPGKDIAGLVVQAAADGTGPAAGERVVGHPEAGGWAEYAAVPTAALAPLPDSVPAVPAAALPLAGLTALRLLRDAGSVAGRRILLTGASGGVGHYVTELAANSERGQRLDTLGAAAVVHDIDASEGPFDLVLESTGGKNLALAVDRLTPAGTLIWFGQASRDPATLSFFDILGGPQTVTIRSFAYWDSPVAYGRDLAVMDRLVAAGRLHPEIGRLAGWEDTAA